MLPAVTPVLPAVTPALIAVTPAKVLDAALLSTHTSHGAPAVGPVAPPRRQPRDPNKGVCHSREARRVQLGEGPTSGYGSSGSSRAAGGYGSSGSSRAAGECVGRESSLTAPPSHGGGGSRVGGRGTCSFRFETFESSRDMDSRDTEHSGTLASDVAGRESAQLLGPAATACDGPPQASKEEPRNGSRNGSRNGAGGATSVEDLGCGEGAAVTYDPIYLDKGSAVTGGPSQPAASCLVVTRENSTVGACEKYKVETVGDSTAQPDARPHTEASAEAGAQSNLPPQRSPQRSLRSLKGSLRRFGE